MPSPTGLPSSDHVDRVSGGQRREDLPLPGRRTEEGRPRHQLRVGPRHDPTRVPTQVDLSTAALRPALVRLDRRGQRGAAEGPVSTEDSAASDRYSGRRSDPPRGGGDVARDTARPGEGGASGRGGRQPGHGVLGVRGQLPVSCQSPPSHRQVSTGVVQCQVQLLNISTLRL